MKAPYEIPDRWNPAGSERGQKAGRLALTQAAIRRKRGRPVGSGHPNLASAGAGGDPEPPKPIRSQNLDPRFAEIDRLIRAGRGDERPRGGRR